MKKKYIKMFVIECIIIVSFVGLYFFTNSKYIKLIPQCYVYKNTGLYCPSCGGTRCITALLNFEFANAFYYHPIFFVSIIFGIIINAYYIITVLTNKKFKLLKWWYAILWLIILLVYTIIRNIN